MTTCETTCPAKLNLYLAVTGRREDGYHDLVSVAAPILLADRLVLRREKGTAENDRLSCDDPAIPAGEGNLVMRAVDVFRQEVAFDGALDIFLEKRIPAGAGFGGGSSDAAGLLRVLNRSLGFPMRDETLQTLAARIGSDCAFFLNPRPAIMRGRGESVAPLPESGEKRLRNCRVVVFKPFYGISTAWAYARLAAGQGRLYTDATEAKANIAAWITEEARLDTLCSNDLEQPVFTCHPAFPILREALQADPGVRMQMTGSGSACFALPTDNVSFDAIQKTVRRVWGESAFCVETRFLMPLDRTETGQAG